MTGSTLRVDIIVSHQIKIKCFFCMGVDARCGSCIELHCNDWFALMFSCSVHRHNASVTIALLPLSYKPRHTATHHGWGSVGEVDWPDCAFSVLFIRNMPPSPPPSSFPPPCICREASTPRVNTKGFICNLRKHTPPWQMSSTWGSGEGKVWAVTVSEMGEMAVSHGSTWVGPRRRCRCYSASWSLRSCLATAGCS